MQRPKIAAKKQYPTHFHRSARKLQSPQKKRQPINHTAPTIRNGSKTTPVFIMRRDKHFRFMVVKWVSEKNVLKSFQMSEQYWGCSDKMSEANFSPAETLSLSNLFHWWKCAPKKSIFTSIQSTTLPHIILRCFYSPFAITTSGFYFRNWKDMWLDENAFCHSENASFTRRFKHSSRRTSALVRITRPF